MKPVEWISGSLKDLKSFPEDVQRQVGFALFLAQNGDKALGAHPLVGFGSANVLEVVIDDDGNTYRAVYTVRFADAVYVLHVFQKKSKRGRETPKPDMDLVRTRLKLAEAHYREKQRKRQKGASG